MRFRIENGQNFLNTCFPERNRQGFIPEDSHHIHDILELSGLIHNTTGSIIQSQVVGAMDRNAVFMFSAPEGMSREELRFLVSKCGTVVQEIIEDAPRPVSNTRPIRI